MKKAQKSQEPEMILENRIVRIQKAREWKRGLFELLVFLAVVYVTFTYIIGVAWVRGDSMSPNLKDGEILLFYRLDKQYKDGDIVLIHMGEDTEFVKRIVAVEGDEVDFDLETGSLLINQSPVEEPFIYTQTQPVSNKVVFPLKIGTGEVFVLGDNREVSMDSREFGCVPLSEITGRVLWHGGSAGQ